MLRLPSVRDVFHSPLAKACLDESMAYHDVYRCEEHGESLVFHERYDEDDDNSIVYAFSVKAASICGHSEVNFEESKTLLSYEYEEFPPSSPEEKAMFDALWALPTDETEDFAPVHYADSSSYSEDDFLMLCASKESHSTCTTASPSLASFRSLAYSSVQNTTKNHSLSMQRGSRRSLWISMKDFSSKRNRDRRKDGTLCRRPLLQSTKASFPDKSEAQEEELEAPFWRVLLEATNSSSYSSPESTDQGTQETSKKARTSLHAVSLWETIRARPVPSSQKTSPAKSQNKKTAFRRWLHLLISCSSQSKGNRRKANKEAQQVYKVKSRQEIAAKWERWQEPEGPFIEI